MEITIPGGQPFDLGETLSCGQSFRWKYSGGWWRGVAHGRLIKIRQSENRLEYTGCSEDLIREYFSLGLDLNRVLASVNRDPLIGAAVDRHRGLRILRQDPWECLLSYLCAQNTGIPNIERMLDNLACRCGDGITTPDGCGCAYPSPEAIASIDPAGIRACSTGYRAAGIYDTACRVAAEPGWADRIAAMNYEDARKALMEYKGVGPKVADCVLLFSFGRLESFPVDVWMRRIMYGHYMPGDTGKSMTPAEYERIRRYGQEYFGEYAGYAQEYLFADRKRL